MKNNLEIEVTDRIIIGRMFPNICEFSISTTIRLDPINP